MKQDLTSAEIERRFADINAAPAEEMTPAEAQSLAAAEAMDDWTSVSLDKFRASLADI